MRLSNPNSNKPFDRVTNDLNGNPEYGYRNEHTPDEEVVHIPTGHSNQSFHQPEIVMNPEGCKHEFIVYDIGKREVECSHCHMCTSFIPGINLFESNGKISIKIKGKKYPVQS